MTAMKKTVLAIAALFFAASVQSWGQAFNNMSLGVGLDNGINLQVATPIGDHLALRLQGSFLPNIFPAKSTVNTSDFPEKILDSFNMEGGKEVTLGIGSKVIQGSLLLDWYPSAYKSFHFSAGIIGGNRGRVIVKTSPLPTDPSGYGKDFIKIDGHEIGTDAEGHLNAALAFNPIRPYVGLGWGRAVPSKRVSVSFDMGLAYSGKFRVKVTDLDGNVCYPLLTTVLTDTGMFSADEKAVKIIDKIVVTPTMRLGINVRLF